MRAAFRKTFAVVALASCAFACAVDKEAAQTRVASPAASGEDGGPILGATPSSMPSPSVATPNVTPDAEAPPSRIATRDEPSDASVDGRSLQEQLRAAADASAASSRSGIGCFGSNPFAGVALQSCKRPGGPTGSGHVVITVAATGEVKSVVVDAGPFPGTPVGDCIVGQFKKARVPTFAGGDVRVGKSFSIH